ncbi:MAG: hypothetical protein HY741_27755 [Chloroflexi bacterium]|nr:hypothetical protein [Chloroflexota bacterium]
MVAIPLELKLPEDKLALLSQAAQARHLQVPQMLEEIVTAWLERELKLQRARQTLREFSRGVANGAAPHDAARNHDAYLYQKL